MGRNCSSRIQTSSFPGRICHDGRPTHWKSEGDIKKNKQRHTVSDCDIRVSDEDVHSVRKQPKHREPSRMLRMRRRRFRKSRPFLLINNLQSNNIRATTITTTCFTGFAHKCCERAVQDSAISPFSRQSSASAVRFITPCRHHNNDDFNIPRVYRLGFRGNQMCVACSSDFENLKQFIATFRRSHRATSASGKRKVKKEQLAGELGRQKDDLRARPAACTQTFFRKGYGMSIEENAAVKKYLEDNFAKGFIHPGTSPRAAPVLIAKK